MCYLEFTNNVSRTLECETLKCLGTLVIAFAFYAFDFS